VPRPDGEAGLGHPSAAEWAEDLERPEPHERDESTTLGTRSVCKDPLKDPRPLR
jgi:hypothetical protein